mgnify:CR=1 FL=1
MKINEKQLRGIILETWKDFFKGKELDPEVAKLVAELESRRTQFVHPDFIQSEFHVEAIENWRRELKSDIRLLKNGKVSPEEIKEKHRIR